MVAPEFFPEDLIVCFDFSFYPCDCESFSGRMAIPKERAVVGYNHHLYRRPRRLSSSSSSTSIVIINQLSLISYQKSSSNLHNMKK